MVIFKGQTTTHQEIQHDAGTPYINLGPWIGLIANDFWSLKNQKKMSESSGRVGWENDDERHNWRYRTKSGESHHL